MDRHGILGMYVVQYELQPGSEGILREPPAASVASLNTHDMPTFRGFWEGRDADDLEKLGFFTAEEARVEKERRRILREGLTGMLPNPPKDDGEASKAVLHDRLARLARSPARMVLVNLEDLWQESEPQNVPGTHTGAPQLAAQGEARLRGALDPAGRGRGAPRHQRASRGEEATWLTRRARAGSGGSGRSRSRSRRSRRTSGGCEAGCCAGHGADERR